MGTDKYSLPYDGMGWYKDHALNTDIVPDGTIPFDNGGGTHGHPIADSGLLTDKDIMSRGEVVSDTDITVQDGA
jgi:hypothetical protein